jgi:uncharacterized protein (TIGR04376 family)
MGLFDDVSRFLEDRLDEFLKNNPHLEIQALLEQTQEQELDTLKLIRELESEKQRLEQDILSIAQDIQTWHSRVSKAQQAGRIDLAQKAQEREAALLRQGNQRWGQMEGSKQRISQAQDLLRQIRQRKQELQAKAVQLQAEKVNNYNTSGWNQGATYKSNHQGVDPLDAEFQRWELNDELERIKRNL